MKHTDNPFNYCRKKEITFIIPLFLRSVCFSRNRLNMFSLSRNTDLAEVTSKFYKYPFLNFYYWNLNLIKNLGKKNFNLIIYLLFLKQEMRKSLLQTEKHYQSWKLLYLIPLIFWYILLNPLFWISLLDSDHWRFSHWSRAKFQNFSASDWLAGFYNRHSDSGYKLNTFIDVNLKLNWYKDN